MSSNDFLDVVGNVDATDIKRSVDPHETSHASHIIPVVAKLVAPETVHVAGKHVAQTTIFLDSCIWQSVEILAVLSLGAKSSGIEKAKVRPRHSVCARISGVKRNVAPALGLML